MEPQELRQTDRRCSLALKAAQLPQSPGVYLMKDSRGAVLYVGKAKALRNRVRSYFQSDQAQNPKTQLLLEHIATIEAIVAPTEKDALILENDLIKRYRPRFNVILRDDKEYPYLRLSVNDPYPALTIVRRPRSDGARYFGPFPSAQAVRETLKVMQRLFPMRTCSNLKLHQQRPCLYAQIGRCPAPCSQAVDPADYHRTVREAELFLQGRNTLVIRELKQRMEEAARMLDFERAALLRDRISAIQTTLQKKTLACRDLRDRDIFSCSRHGTQYAVAILFIRASRVMGSRTVILRALPVSDQEALSSFIAQYYDQGNYIPDEILVPYRFESLPVMMQWLREKKGAGVAIICPQRGFRKTLLTMATDNAQLAAQQQEQAAHRQHEQLEELRMLLRLKTVPKRIACVDISNISGSFATGAVVVFHNAQPDKSSYRRYRIRSVPHADDYAMMQEVLSRFLARAQSEQLLPDLLMVDGGKGQLAVLTRVLHELGISSVAALALAKGRSRHQPGTPHRDQVFIPGRKNPLFFPRQSCGLLLLQRIRDEAHRFAITYHTHMRKAQSMHSPLEQIPDIGPRTAQALLKHFGSMEVLRHASLAELQQVPHLTVRRAHAVFTALKNSTE